MPHLDEGLLHAYLDGALAADDAGAGDVEQHLSACAECRARLEKARSVKESAETILAGAGPVDVTMPSFQELQARAQSRGSDSDKQGGRKTGGQQRSLYQLKSLAWAATVVLAVAVGWYARSTILPTDQGRFASEDETRARLAIPIPEPEGEATSPDTEPHEPTSEQVTLDVVGAVVTPAEREETLLGSQVVSPEPTEAPLRSRETRQVSAAPLQADERVAVEPVVTQPVVTHTVAGRGGGATSIWTSVDEATAISVLEGPVPKVEGLPVIGYATSSVYGRRTIRVHQSLDSGRILQLVIFTKNDSEPIAEAQKGVRLLDAVASAVADSVHSIAVQRGNLSIRLSGALTVDSLLTLGESVGRGN